MNDEDIKKEYINFLNDTNKKNNVQAWAEFKREFIGWYVEMFGITDKRTKNIIHELNHFKWQFL